VQRTKSRRKREWITGSPKSKTSRRTVLLPDWLAVKRDTHLKTMHPAAGTPTAVRWRRRLHGNHVIKPQLDWSAPLDLNGLQSKLIRPALGPIGLREPASESSGGWNAGRRHERRSTARPSAHSGGQGLTNGVHFIQVAKRLGHSSYVLTLTTYADYIPKQEAENPLPEPVAAVRNTNVMSLFG
jgi:integrase